MQKKTCETMDFGYGLQPWAEPIRGLGESHVPQGDFSFVGKGIAGSGVNGPLNPGPTGDQASTDLFGRPHGDEFLGPQDSKMHEPSFTPIVHTEYIQEQGVVNLDGERFYPKGQIIYLMYHPNGAAVQVTKLKRRIQMMHKRLQDMSTPHATILSKVHAIKNCDHRPLLNYNPTRVLHFRWMTWEKSMATSLLVLPC
jgi:hypothetical protein